MGGGHQSLLANVQSTHSGSTPQPLPPAPCALVEVSDSLCRAASLVTSTCSGGGQKDQRVNKRKGFTQYMAGKC